MNQDDIIRFLSDPATHGGQTPEIISTHISVVFLAGDRAWKLKKAVRLSFLDFSTLQARHTACLSELEVNRTAAPDLYLGLMPVTTDDTGGLHLGGAGKVVDWLVEMRRFAQDDLLSELLRRDRVDRRMIQQVAEAAFAAHRAAPLRPDKGGAAGLDWTITTNATAMTAQAAILPPAKAAHLAEASRAWLHKLTPCWRNAGHRARCGAAMATCIAAISACTRVRRCRSTPSNFPRTSPASMFSTIWPFC